LRLSATEFVSSDGKSAIVAALAAAALFGASAPAAKALSVSLSPFALAGLLYIGSGLGLGTWLLARRLAGRSVPLGISAADLPWLAAAILAGGVVAPALAHISRPRRLSGSHWASSRWGSPWAPRSGRRRPSWRAGYGCT